MVSRSGKNSKHLVFTDVLGLLRPGDVVVVNDTKVIPSRLVGRKPTGAHCEVLLLKPWVGKADCPTSFSNVIKSRSFFESQIWKDRDTLIKLFVSKHYGELKASHSEKHQEEQKEHEKLYTNKFSGFDSFLFGRDFCACV